MEPVAKAIEAKIVSESDLFDDPLFSTLKELNVEELLSRSIEIIDGLNMKTLTSSDFKELPLIKLKIKANLQQLILLFGEIFRRGIDIISYGLASITLTAYIININTFVEEDKCKRCCETKYLEFHSGNDIFCSSCKVKNLNMPTLSLISATKDYFDQRQLNFHNSTISHTNSIKQVFVNYIKDMKMVKETMIKILKTPLLTKDLESCMDEILDLNGNKISQMKDYLTEEQYRFVRSGARFEDLPKQQELLDNFNEMLKDLKRRVIVEVSSQPIKILERDLMTQKKKQKDYEKDLEKLKTKI